MLVKQTKILIYLTLLAWLTPAMGKNKQLNNPDELHAVPTVLRSVQGVQRIGQHLFLFGPRLDHFVRMPFKPEGKTREQRFGAYIQSERIPIPASKYPGDWHGILDTDPLRTLVWDASMLQLTQFNQEKKRIIQELTVAVDTLKPPADRMGEPTNAETAKAQQAMRTSYKKVFGPRYTGMAALPDGWLAGKKNYHALSTMIPSYPLVVMGCATDDPLACVMERFCYLEGGPSIKPKNVAGVATSAKGRLLAMGDSERHQVHIYRWESCMNIKYITSLEAPPMIRPISSIHIDADDQLWIATKQWENRFDSNVYYWEAGKWRP